MASIDILSIKQRFGIIGNSPLLNVAIEKAALAAPTDMTVLITGESGSGKESFSKIIHQLSSRKHNQFIAINCGAIPEGTIDSELFGHEKGAFTGAVDSRKGYFETVNGGTIFLDEIGEMPLGTQARLLRVLENGDFIRVGSSKVQKTDVRVVAATNVNLLKAVEKGSFREDLYYRLNTIPIFVPPLRERGTDIVLLFRKFASDFAERYRVKPVSLTEDASLLLQQYRFPGNIRQLKNLVEQISVLEIERDINSEKLRTYIPQEQGSSVPTLFKGTEGQNFTERELLYKVLFDLKRDVTELKKLFYDTVSGGNVNREVIKQHADLFRDIEEEPEFATSTPTPKPIYLDSGNEEDDAIELARIEDISHETEDDSLDLEKKEKEMIIKALRKNRNKRKYAAKDLNISERTLYRKIKQYHIE
ncbi:sigma-54 interaction domain-containing protein [Xanthocytophaga agilis]|uniref:Sigma 54-interacting transcriptional regulator n=1 Tax=Xanthocytophaga agilis TaxID=3048010 RepID=A0AAE3QYJ7_9BACT|nr:sigma 54-interacting transcriptional regulator [Xanthocytophaga agilis]MDJ1499835.1 sigma 54-interacting transcriptional regulator [Xanthocytophaga agilis]